MSAPRVAQQAGASPILGPWGSRPSQTSSLSDRVLLSIALRDSPSEAEEIVYGKTKA